MKIGLLFSGQGSQKVGMGRDLYEAYPDVREFYDQIQMGFDLKAVSFEGDEQTLKQTIYTQPVLVAFHLAVLKQLKALGIPYEYVAGLSLGEFSALVAGGVLEEKEALALIEKRAQWMSKACEETEGGLLAVMGLEVEEVEEAIEEVRTQGAKLQIANLNCPKQVVVGGSLEDLQIIKGDLEEHSSARLAQLEVQGGFHTDLMESAYQGFSEDLKGFTFKDASTPVIYNRLGTPGDRDQIQQLLAEQLKSTTYFEKSIRYMIDQGVDIFLEIGCNDIFKGFLKRIDRKIRVIPVNSVETLEQLKEELSA